MTRNQFYRLISENFDPVLLPHGFSREGSKRCVYWRRVGEEIFHIIGPDALRSIERYDIHVYASSPIIEDGFGDGFPDHLPYTNADWGYLSPEDGVSDYQKLYFCGNPDAFMTSFRRDTAPALVKHALPYLEKIQTMEDLIATIRYDGMRGAALAHIRRDAEARPLIAGEVTRLENMPPDRYGQLERSLAFYREILSKIDSRG